MPDRKQRYQITITRETNGQWRVNGYWEVPKYSHSDRPLIWDLDGAPRFFNTRKEALEFCLTVSGVPE